MTLLTTVFADDKSDPLLRWNHPNHAAGFVADLAVLLYEREDPETLTASSEWNGTKVICIPSNLYYTAAKAVVRATRRVWTASDRRMFAAHWGTITHNPLSLARNDYNNYNYRATPYANLVIAAARLLVSEHVERVVVNPHTNQVTDPQNNRVNRLCSAASWTTIDQDDVRQIEIKWRIRDWLALTDDVTNIPLRCRQAATAAWRADARQVAFQIVLAGAATVAAKHRD